MEEIRENENQVSKIRNHGPCREYLNWNYTYLNSQITPLASFYTKGFKFMDVGQNLQEKSKDKFMTLCPKDSTQNQNIFFVIIRKLRNRKTA